MMNTYILKLDQTYSHYPKQKIIKYLKHFPEYLILFFHIFFLDRVIKKISYKLWQFLKDKLTFIKKAKLFIDKDFYITIPPYTDIYRYGAYIHTLAEYKLTKFFLKNLEKIKIFFDIGANYGYYSFLITNLNRETIAYAFEPNPYALKILNLNKNERIIVIPCAVGGENKKIKFEKGHFMNSLATNIILEENKEDYVEVDMITLDNFCSEKKVVPDFIKIDVERIEDEVIKGGLNLIKTHHPILSLEIYLNERFREYEKVLKILKGLGYKSFYINFSGCLEEREITPNLRKEINLDFDNFIFKSSV